MNSIALVLTTGFCATLSIEAAFVVDRDFRPVLQKADASVGDVRSSQEVRLAADRRGGFYAYGNFQFVDGTPRTGLARFNADGSLDVTFSVHLPQPMIVSLLLQEDDSVLIADAVNATWLRVFGNGTLDRSFARPISSEELGSWWNEEERRTLQLGPSRYYVSAEDPRMATYIRRTPEDGFAVQISFTPFVHEIGLAPTGNIFVAGQFSWADNHAYSGLVRLHANGTVDHSFQERGVAFSHGGPVLPLADGGVILSFPVHRRKIDGAVDPEFRPPEAVTRVLAVDRATMLAQTGTKIVRLRENGQLDLSFESPALTAGNRLEVLQAVIHGDGSYTALAETNGFGLLRLEPNGAVDQSFIPAVSAGTEQISRIASWGDKVIVSGFRETGSRPYFVRRLEANGALDPSFNLTLRSNFAHITALNVQRDGKVIVAALEEGALGSALFRVRPDGSMDGSFPHLTLPGGSVAAIAVQANGAIVFGGYFDTIEGRPHFGIARLIERPALQRPRFGPDGTFSVDLSFENTATHWVESSENLRDWTRSQVGLSVQGEFSLHEAVDGKPQRFYRIRTEPEPSL